MVVPASLMMVDGHEHLPPAPLPSHSPSSAGGVGVPAGASVSAPAGSGAFGHHLTVHAAAAKKAGLSSFIQAALAELDEEGGTPIEHRTPAASVDLDLQRLRLHTAPPAKSSFAAEGGLASKPRPGMLAEGHLQLDGLASPSAAIVELSPAAGAQPGSGSHKHKAAWGSMKQKPGAPPILPPVTAPTTVEQQAPSPSPSPSVSSSHSGSVKSHKPSKSRKAGGTSSTSGSSSSASSSALVSPSHGGGGSSNAPSPLSAGSGADSHARAFKNIKATLGPVSIGGTDASALRHSRIASSKKIDVSASGIGGGGGGVMSPSGVGLHIKDVTASFSAGSGAAVSSSSSFSGDKGGNGSTKPGGGKKKLKKKGKGKKSGGASSILRLPPSGITLSRAIPSAPIRCVVAVDRTKEVWTAEKDGVIVVRDAQTGDVVERLHASPALHNHVVTTLACVEDCVWAGTEAGKLLRIDPVTRTLLPAADVAGGPVGSGTSTSGGGFATGSATATGAGGGGMARRTFTSAIQIIVAVKERVFTGSADFMIRAWNARTGAYLRTYSGHSLSIRTLLPMGSTHLWSGSDDKTIRIHQVDTGECCQVLTGHTDAVTALVATGVLVCSASADGCIRVWRAVGVHSSVNSSAEQTQQQGITGGGGGGVDFSTLPPQWECIQVVPCHVGRISALLVVSRNMLWSVGQHEKVVVWNLASGGGSAAGAGSARTSLVITKKKELEGGHAAFITGLQLVRRTEVKSIWSHSLSTAPASAPGAGAPSPTAASGGSGEANNATGAAGGGANSNTSGGDKLCLWQYVSHNGKDVNEQLQVARNKNHALTWMLHSMYAKGAQLGQQLAHAQRSFGAELQRLILLLAESYARGLEQAETVSSQSGKITSLSASLASAHGEHSALAQAHEELQTKLRDNAELHEEYADNLKRVIADGTKRREQAEDALAQARAEMERMEQRLDDEMAARAEQQRRAEEAETCARALQDEMSSLRASHDSLALQAAHSQLASQAEEVLLSELSAARNSLAEAEGARQAEAARATQVAQENARLASELKKAAASAAKGDVLASDLSTLSSTVERLRRQVAEQLLKPVRALSKDNVTGRQEELVNQVTVVANELAEAAAKLRNVMHMHLTPEQMMHVGISPNAMQTAQAAAQAAQAQAQAASAAPAQP
jgi:hypothetical protein